MKKKTWMIKSIVLIIGAAMIASASCAAEQKSGLLESVKNELKKKTARSGTLDIYDDDTEKVRNLRVINVEEKISEQDGKYFVLADYRDINTGDIVRVEIDVVSAGERTVLEDIRIQDVRTMGQDESLEAKEYTDQEIQAFMMEHLQKQGQFNEGKIMLFDKDSGQMRNLELKTLDPEVRRMGIFYSSSAQFADVAAGEILDIDMSVENKKGTLNVQALRIRNVRPVLKK